ncbi:TPA: hypothetical protein ACH3X1_007327 [Trebouxia sp. C0004]
MALTQLVQLRGCNISHRHGKNFGTCGLKLGDEESMRSSSQQQEPSIQHNSLGKHEKVVAIPVHCQQVVATPVHCQQSLPVATALRIMRVGLSDTSQQGLSE